MSEATDDPIELWINSLSEEEVLELEKRGSSRCCEVRKSSIHGSGVFASCDIEDGELLFEYIGQRIDKEDSDARAWSQIDRAKESGEASVLIFTLNDEVDIDGRIPWNLARYINHCCEPNAQAWIEDVDLPDGSEEERIYIYATKAIAKGSEIGFNYGFDLENWSDHPCLCGKPTCVGYIAGEEYWDELKEKIATNHS